MSEARKQVRAIAHEHLARGDALGWFEAVYSAAAGDVDRVPWADRVANPLLIGWLERELVRGDGRRALVVGCGLGDDAVALADRGFVVTAFDLSPTAIGWCHRRFPDSPVDWRVADLFALRADLHGAFDFVFEAYTLQSFGDAPMRNGAMRALAATVARGGTLLVVARGRDLEAQVDGPPWPLALAELAPIERAGLRCEHHEDFYDDEPQRRLRVEYRRPAP